MGVDCRIYRRDEPRNGVVGLHCSEMDKSLALGLLLAFILLVIPVNLILILKEIRRKKTNKTTQNLRLTKKRIQRCHKVFHSFAFPLG